jgi:signal transduction histidine kinase
MLSASMVAIAAAAGTLAALVPHAAPATAVAGVGVAAVIAWLHRRRAMQQVLAETLIPDEERSADHEWELADIAEHYRRTATGRRRAEAASEAKSRFLATVSHELRTPLGGVLGLSGILIDTPLTPEQETFARAIRTSGELMLGLVDDMLDFAKIEAGRFDNNPPPPHLAAL